MGQTIIPSSDPKTVKKVSGQKKVQKAPKKK
jgi:hypothetical protein